VQRLAVADELAANSYDFKTLMRSLVEHGAYRTLQSP